MKKYADLIISLYKCPVPGWIARQSVTICKGKRTDSYEVYECPRFERR